MNPILVTGAAGFVGFHVVDRLLREGRTVVGVDNLNSYYSVELKVARVEALGVNPDALRSLPPSGEMLSPLPLRGRVRVGAAEVGDSPPHPGPPPRGEGVRNFQFEKLDLANRDATAELFGRGPWEAVLHFAAQPGVRYSLENPEAYVDSNLVALANVLEGCRHAETGHLVLASSSSIYGASSVYQAGRAVPFATADPADHPVSLYAATKRSGELLAHAYSHQFGLPTTVLRLFTVYGPWGRPDMALWKFAAAIEAGQPIDVYRVEPGGGPVRRDFTYIDDVVEGIMRVLPRPPQRNECRPSDGGHAPQTAAPLRVYNLGSHRPEPVSRLIDLLEQHLGRPALHREKPLPSCELPETFADIEPLAADFGFRPETPLEVGVERFVAWWRERMERRLR